MVNWEYLTINAAELNCESLLLYWQWLVSKELRPFSLTLFGDWFFEDDSGHIHFLDTVGGQLKEIAPDRASFLEMRERQENLDEWYMAELALVCLERGLRPGPGQCLSFKIPPVLSGPLDPDNIEVCDLMVHESIIGQIHKGVRNLPEGTRIGRFTVDGEEP